MNVRFYGSKNLWEMFRGNAENFGLSDEQSYWLYSMLGAIPGVGSLQSASDSYERMRDYMRNRELDYGSVKYPTKTLGYGVSQFGSGMVALSSNVSRLYR